MRHTKVLIIGSGPAGHTAAIYAARANMAPIVLEGSPPNLPGGQLMLTTDIENFPGFGEGISGPVLMEEMRKQAQRVGAEFITENATTVDFSQRPFFVGTEYSGNFEAETVIVSTGASAKWLGLPGETALMSKGVSACATCDGYFFRGRDVLVVGGGDTALEEALYLSRMARKVTLIHRRDTLRGSAIMQRRLIENEKISVVWNSVITHVHDVESGKFTGVTLANLRTHEESFLVGDGLFIAIGHKPNTDLLRGKLELDDQGYIITRPGTAFTSVEGVFAAGDVQDSNYRQAITAAGTGCMAAMDAERYLEGIAV
jgi:thioredoxin reductase (NADPH)